MEIKEFGARLRELRKQAGLSQRELADKVNVSFTYLSKIENGVVAPPSKSVILKLAEVLNADKDELMTLAGKIPADIGEKLLKNPEMLHLIRSKRAQKIFKAFSKARTGLQNLTTSLQNSTKGTGLFFKNHQGLSRVAISVAMVLAIVVALWSASPAQALTISITNPAGQPLDSGTLGSAYRFTVKVQVEDVDRLPIQSVDLYIYKSDNRATYEAHFANLPLTTTTITPDTRYKRTSAQTASGTSPYGGAVVISAVTGDYWGYASASRYGYGYGYQTGTWGTQNLGTGTTFGYGYGYSPYIGATDITYTITWTPPASWPPGTYEIRVLVYGNGGVAFTTPTPPTFNLSAYIPYIPPPPTVETTLFGIEASFSISDEGVIQETIEATSDAGDFTITIPESTIALDEDGDPLSTLTVELDLDPPDPPAEAHIIGIPYNLGPPGATFSPPITIEFTVDPATLPPGVAVEDLVLAYYDEVAGEWVELTTTYDPATNTFTASVYHFTTFAVIAVPAVAPPAPAAFSVSSLSIQPAEVEPAEVVTIAVLVANTGGEAGSYQVTLVINDLVEATKEVTVRAGLSKEVTFSVTKEEAGSYTVTVDGLSGSFTVVPVVAPPAPATFSVSYLSVSPRLEVEPGETVTITVLVANTGGESGSYTAVLKIDGVKEAEKAVTIAAGESQDVSFSVTKEEAGDYTVDVDGLSGSFTVVAPPVKPISWWVWLIVGLASAVAAGLLVYFLWWRRRIA